MTATGQPLRVDVSDALLGRALDGLGRPLDGKGPIAGRATWRPRRGSAPPDPLSRPRIHERVSLGVRALDALVPCGRGQRLGIFAGSGVGKSSLLGMIARVDLRPRSTSSAWSASAVERCCEFIERDLGPEGLARSVVVVRDVRPARARAHQGRVHGDRDRGVLPRPGPRRDADDGLGHALRHGPARGRPGDRRAARHARLHAVACSRCCRSCSSAPARRPRGSITGLYTVLVDGDDMNEPIADAVRGILDGHIVLSRHLAHAGHYPAIDVLASVSRLVGEIVTPEVRAAGNEVRKLMADLQARRPT